MSTYPTCVLDAIYPKSTAEQRFALVIDGTKVRLAFIVCDSGKRLSRVIYAPRKTSVWLLEDSVLVGHERIVKRWLKAPTVEQIRRARPPVSTLKTDYAIKVERRVRRELAAEGLTLGRMRAKQRRAGVHLGAKKKR